VNTTEANTSTSVFPTLPQYQSENYEQIFSSTRLKKKTPLMGLILVILAQDC